jgi:hypothetical protein
MDSHLKVLGDKRIHTVIDHQHGTFGRVKNGKVKHSPQKILLFAEFLHPTFIMGSPFFLILMQIVFSFENKLQLVVTIVFITEQAHEIDIKLMQVPEVGVVMFLYFSRHLILDSKRITSEEIFDLHKIDEVLKQGVLLGKLRFLEDIILIKWKEFPNHVLFGFSKIIKKGLTPRKTFRKGKENILKFVRAGSEY